ncbi:hypothetical protein M0R45_005371 [Rubus argutus]|uniref:tRNA(His) guanylyltransferase n=1 Tax=Rubus argutus TaxID=59490 RepID=A0AAW1YM87_RUBAR
MANRKYEYVKSYEVEDEIFLPNIIVVRIDGRVHEFKKSNDVVALNLLNSCAVAVSEEFPDIVFSYGFSDKYSFVFKKASKFYQRRASKVESIIVSFFSSVYVTKWREFFPQKELRYPPSFHAKVIPCAAIEVLQAYLLWRQNDCHTNNLHNTCLWELMKDGKTESEALELLEGTCKEEKNDLLFDKFEINYQKLDEMFRQGSCILKTEVIDVVKHNENGSSVRRLRKKIDGCHFHRFSDVHEFVKPNVFSYGVSDEYSFVLKKDSQFYQKRASEIVSVVVSFFTSMYTMK